MFAAIFGVSLVVGGVAAIAFTFAVLRDRWAGPPTAGWGNELVVIGRAAIHKTSTPVPIKLREPCWICRLKHCAGCENPATATATRTTNYQARHDFSEVPLSLRWLASKWSVTGRAALIAREVNPNWRPRPQGEAWRVWAKQKLGRELQTGRVLYRGVLDGRRYLRVPTAAMFP